MFYAGVEGIHEKESLWAQMREQLTVRFRAGLSTGD